MVWLLVTNFILIGALAIYVGQDFFRLGPDEGDSGSGKLARRFAILFSLAAIIPAILVAVFLGTSLKRSIDNWFSERIPTIIENSASGTRSNLQSVADDIRIDIGIMAKDLNNAVVGYKTEPDVFARYLLQQASFRDFAGALLIDSDGNVLLSSDAARRRTYEFPTDDMFETANSGDVSVKLSDETSQFWALFKLVEFDDAYLYTVRPINPSLLTNLINSEQALEDYRLAEEQSRRLQVIFLLGFIQITSLILLFFVRYGFWAANQITRPIARLAIAADNVRKGDLNVQVPMPRLDNEVAELTASFNAMTTRLREQRDAIDEGHREAIERTLFIEAVLNGVSAGVVRIDDNLVVTLTNPSACNMFPKLRSETAVRLPTVCPEFSQLAVEAMDARSPKSTSIVMNDDWGQRHFLVRAEPILEDNTGCILTFDDTSGLITAQRQMAWRDVARRVAHEIRNPLTPIQLSAERLKRRYRKLIDEDDLVFDRCVDTISRQVSDIGRMVEEFSSFARMPKPEVERFDLVALVKNGVYDRRLSKPEIDYSLDVDLDKVSIIGDRRLIGQALTNVLKNAGEAVERAALEHDDPKFKASVHTIVRLGQSVVEIDVIDTGTGFPDNRLQILEPYFTTREQGIGLGLAIVNRIVQDHGGQILLLDRDDGQRGARVAIRLPLSGPSNEIVSNWTSPEEQVQ
jgi:two-component system nitrogen regulation sensor histidine kinase NtrY